MLTLSIPASHLPEVEEVARELLPLRAARVKNGLLDGHHWFISLLRDADLIARRRRLTRSRKAT